MGLFDGALGDVVGNVLGGMANDGTQGRGGNPLLQLAMQLLQQNGGLAGLVETFKKQGLGREADSWVGTGANLPVSLDQIKQVLGGVAGGGGLAALAGQLGLSEDDAGNGLARTLPELINQLTPEGRIPDNAAGAGLEQMLAGLGGRLFGG